MLAVQAEIQQQEDRILQQITAISQSISTRYDIALGRERALTAELEREKDRARELTSKAVQYSVLQREMESNKNLYDTLLNRVKETALTSGLETSNVKTIDRADVPQDPVRPRKRFNLLLGLVAGLGVGVGLAFLLEHLDDSLESPEDVEKYLNIPFLGAMGYVKDAPSAEDGKEDPRAKLLALTDPKSPVAEALRNIRTYISFRLRGHGEKSFVVTSANPNEGKTFFAANMAAMLAAAEKRTVLVSADLRKPRAYQMFGLERTPGLADALVGELPFEAVIQESGVPNLWCVTAGLSLPNPAELLTSERMSEFHALLEERFDFVVYDTPPILYVTDALIVSQIAHNVVLVVERGSTERKAARRVVQQLEEVEARILGVALNEAKVAQGRYYGRYSRRYYGRYYHHYYDEPSQAEDSGKKKKRRALRA